MDANWRRDAIVELLRQKGKVKARELAKRFHVTRQTICQDITVLSLHCDIYTERGQNGGIYLLEKRGPFVNRLVHLRFKYLNNFCLLYQRKSVLSFSPYQDTGFVVTNELGMYFEQRTFKDYYNRMLQDAGIGHFTFHALRHTFATRALERGMDYKTLSAIRGHYSVSFTMDTYVHSMDEHKRNEMDKMDDLFGISLEISVEQQPYPVLFTVTEEGCKAFAPDFPKIQIQAGTMETALMEAKKQIQKALSQFKYPPIPTRQEDIVVQENSVLILLKTA